MFLKPSQTHVLWIFRLNQTKSKEEGFLVFFAAVVVPIDWNIDCSKKPRKINETCVVGAENFIEGLQYKVSS